jgi:N utilization substance protein B
MKSRHRAREIALQILYQYDLAQRSFAAGNRLQLVDELRNHYEHFQVPQELREFVGQLVIGTLITTSELDPILEKQMTHWRIPRLSAVDRCILRMVVYEMVHLRESPRNVIIDEAIELAKEFGSEESPSFVNGVLDQIHPEKLASST